MRNSVIAGVRGVAQNLAVPHGFTLVIGGLITILIGERGFPGTVAVCLFVVGANSALILCQATVGAHRFATGSPATGLGVYNIAPSATVPAVALVVEHIEADRVAFLCAGFLGACCYVCVAGALMAALTHSRPTER